MGSLLSARLMKTKGEEYLRSIAEELVQNAAERARVLDGIVTASDAPSALETMKSFSSWLDKGRPSASMRALEKLCSSAISAACCSSISRSLELEAEELTNRGWVLMDEARRAVDRGVLYLTDVRALLKWNEQLQKALTTANVDYPGIQVLTGEQRNALAADERWKSQKPPITRLAGKDAFTDPEKASAAGRMKVAKFPENADLAAIVNDGVRAAATRVALLSSASATYPSA